MTTVDIDKETVLSGIAQCGSVLGACLLIDPKNGALNETLATLKALKEENAWPFGNADEVDTAFCLLCDERTDDVHGLAREYQRLFIGPAHFEAPPWGSVYLDSEQVILGDSLVVLRKWMKWNGIAINDGLVEPEDQIGKMLVLLGWLATEKPELVEEFLADHLMPWAPRYFDLMESDAKHPFYRGIAQLSRTTLADMCRLLGVEPKKLTLYF